MTSHDVDIALLSEPKIFAHDVQRFMQFFRPDFCFSLNSEDRYDQELPLSRSQAFGGTLAIWKTSLDPFISVHPVTTSSFLPIIFSPLGSPPSIHIALYLPTSGQEIEFVEAITNMRVVIDDLKEIHPDATVYIRGDSNVNKNNIPRSKLFRDFVENLELQNVPTNHNTYHHFVGAGMFDSSIDIIMHTSNNDYHEEITGILCQADYPEVDSHHDAILSSVCLPCCPPPAVDTPCAPRIPNSMHKIVWKDENLHNYVTEVSSKLTMLRKNWSFPGSKVSVSILLELTNIVLGSAASSNNKSVLLNQNPGKKTLKIPKEIRLARQQLNKAHRMFKCARQGTNEIFMNEARADFISARRKLRFITRKSLHKADLERYDSLHSILHRNPASLFKAIKSNKRNSSKSVPFITTGGRKFVGEKVPDGLYESIANLKRVDSTKLSESPMYQSWTEDYNYILQLCKNRRDIPPLSLDQSTSILFRMKSCVRDFWSITPLHYRNAGHEGLVHFNFLMNLVIREINTSTVKELNTVHALLLHKGHGKSVTSDRSYRTISTCPVIAKALDIHIHDLFIDNWNEVQADTQYQGEGTSHELASLLVTETIQHSLYNLKEPLFMLLLDARSAFDTVVTKFLVRNLYLTGMTGSSLLYMDNRLSNRVTYCSWDQELMGPIRDEHGLEQGGCNSSDNYKIYNNELLKTVQKSCQGVDLGNHLVVSAVGQADDVALLSNNIFKLYNILHLTLKYCRDYHVELCADKTRLLQFSPSSSSLPYLPFNPIRVNNQQIDFSLQGEHVGIIRSPSGNLPHLMHRFTAHRKALGAVLFSGLARNHRGNLAAAVKIEKLYALPVLLSGLASLVLTKSEENMIDQHYIGTLRNLLKTNSGTPRSFVLFMCGSLPASALLHLKQLGLFSMITRLPKDPLHIRATYSLTTGKVSNRSWFTKLRHICLQYGLPHPLTLLQTPLTKDNFKKMAKSHVIGYWEDKLRGEAIMLPSLDHFNPYFHSLTRPHPTLTTPGSNPHEVCKAVVQCKMKSGRYSTSHLSRHWSPGNPLGHCQAPTCKETCETLEHLIISCPYYNKTRDNLVKLWTRPYNTTILSLLLTILAGPPHQLLSFILDPAAHPHTIHLCQVYNQNQDILKILFYLTRTWCYSIHKERLKLLKKWNF